VTPRGRRARGLAAIDPDEPYEPTLGAERVEWIRAWHQAAYEAALDEGEGGQHFTYHGLELDVPADVMPITATSHLLGDAVHERARRGARVLDMGCGCGVNAILAARRGALALAVDVNEAAVEATRANAERNGVADRVEAKVSDVFSHVEGEFDLIAFDPPYRWFEPRDRLEAAMSDPGYRTLRTFFSRARGHLAPGGSILVAFATSGDLDYLRRLVARAGLREAPVAQSHLGVGGSGVDYVVLALTADAGPPRVRERRERAK
jgi:release factor glutamine methyltransferase